METISIISVIISVVAGFVTKLLGDRVNKKSNEPKDIEQQVATLDNITNNLNELHAFIQTQKKSLIDNEKTIQELEEERRELTPVVETQREVINTILKIHSKDQKRKRMFDYLIGFFIGIASSAVVTLFFLNLNR